MTLPILKQQLLAGNIDDEFKIFVYDDNSFLADQYIDKICELKGYIKNNISSIYETKNSSMALIIDYNSKLNILRVETFDELASNYSDFTNTVVVCNKIDKKLKQYTDPYRVDFPKLEEWQILDYVKLICSGLKDDEIAWLCTACNGDIYKILNEIDKLMLFDINERHDILDQLRFDSASDLYYQDIFGVTESILKRDKITLAEIMKHIKNFNFDPIALTNLLLGTLKKIILVKLNSGASAAEIGISPKQYNAFKKYLYNNLKPEQIFNATDFLSGIDLRLKSSELDLSKQKLLEYLIANILV